MFRTSQVLPVRRQALLLWASVLLAALVSAGLLTLAFLDSVAPVAVALLVAVGLGAPLAAGLTLPAALRVVPGRRRQALRRLRRQLDELPETRHPLDP